MSAKRKRVISTDEMRSNHKSAKMLLTEKWGVSQNGQTPNLIGICIYCVQDRPVFEWNQVLLHPELTPWRSFLFAGHQGKISLFRVPNGFARCRASRSVKQSSGRWVEIRTWNCCYIPSFMRDVIAHPCLNTLRPRQNGCHFPDDIFKWIFLKENI